MIISFLSNKSNLYADYDSQIYGNGYGGKITTEAEEDVDFKEMVICKNEVNYH